ncbi:DedA family protein [Streptomyces blattellae]|uniref:DedA family protein n=1 Tax=Streptomyces blattellae TaxID=2569855 RepID=UPI0012B9EA78|nr:DedA family protein [Streptomyces blattellae]
MDVDALIEAAGWWSYVVVFLMTAGETSAFIGLLLPGETVILVASAVAGRGDLDPVLLAVLVVAGGMTGDNLGFALGRWCERRPSRGRLHRFRSDQRIERARAFLMRHGGAAVFTGRFIGFVRTFLPFAAGASGMPYRRFFLYSSAASLVWGIGNVLIGYFAGAAVIDLLHSIGLITAAVLAAVAVAAFIVVRLLTRRRRPAWGTSLTKAPGEPRAASEQEPMHMFSYSQEG